MLAHAWGSPPLDHATAALLSARVKTLSAAYWVSGNAGVGPTQPEGVSIASTSAFRHRHKLNAVYGDGHVATSGYPEAHVITLWNP